MIKDNVIEELTKLKQQTGKNINTVGSATLVRSLLGDNVVDELSLLVYPIVGNFGSGGDDGMMDGGMDGGMWTWLLGSILFLVVLAAVVVGVIFVVRSQWTRGATESSPGRALEILKERYARGEIDRQEYEERRRVLEERL
jgi:putative membrane protein